MPRTSSFSADDHASYTNPEMNPSIGQLDAHYRAQKTGQSASRAKPVRHVAVRDASGSYTDEEPVNAFMVPSKYLSPTANKNMPPKRPLGSSAVHAKEPVKMYSQVAAFAPMARVRRPRMASMTIPVMEQDDESWMDRVKHYAGVAAALIVAGALVVADKAKATWSGTKKSFAALPLVHPRATYSAFRGARFERLGMQTSWFRVVAPTALALFIFGLAIFSGFVGENLLHPGKSSNGDSVQQGSTVLQVTPGKGGGSATNNAAAGGAGGGSSPQTAGSTSQAGSGGAGGVQPASGTTQSAGGFGGGSGGTGSLGGVTSPGSSGGTGTPTVPSGSGGGGIVPSTPVPTPSVPNPTVTPPPVPDPSQCICGEVQNLQQSVNSTLAPVTQPLESTKDSATGSLGL